MRVLMASVMLSVAVACGTETPSDAGARDSASVDASATGVPWIESGEPPTTLAPCPPGWREDREGSGVTTCDPSPEGGPPACAAGEAWFLGAAACEPVGSPCSSDGLVADLPADTPVIHVASGATGGDGSRAMPWGALGDFAWGRLTTGTIVAVGRGTYDHEVRLPRGIELRGACARDTAIVSSIAHDREGVVTVVGPDAILSSVTIGPAGRTGVSVSGTESSLHVQGVIVEGTTGRGVLAIGGSRVEGERLVVADTNPGTSTGGGRGLTTEVGSAVVLADVLFERNHEVAVFGIDAGTSIVLSDAAIRETQPAPDDTVGWGLEVELGASADASRVLLEGNHDVAAYASDDGTTLSLRDAVVRGTLPQRADGLDGRGINVQLGAVATVERTLVEDSHGVAVLATHPGTTLTLNRGVVHRTRSTEVGGMDGWGVNVQMDAVGELREVVVAANRGVGVIGLLGSMSLTDVLVVDSGPTDCGVDDTCPATIQGIGLAAIGSQTMVQRFAVRASSVCGVELAARASLDLRQGEVSGSPIGVCLQVPDYPLDRLTDRVVFMNNDINLQATDLPVPDPRPLI